MPQFMTRYFVKSGDTLSKIAKKFHITLEAILQANQHIHDPNLISIGQAINIPTGKVDKPSRRGAQQFDGIHPAPGCINTNRAAFSHPPLINLPDQRNPQIYEQVINQFAVGHNPRFLRQDQSTFCNIFLWDVTRAFGVEIPHWIMSDGAIAEPFSPGARELVVNATMDWMKEVGVPRHGWRSVDAEEAQANANAGQPSVVMWRNPTGGPGHTAVLRHGEVGPRGAVIAQAGATNFNHGFVKESFHTKQGLKYYAHD